MSTIIRGGTIVGPYGSAVTDLRIDGEQITALGTIAEAPEDQLIDAGGCLVLPGGIDTHTHLDLPPRAPRPSTTSTPAPAQRCSAAPPW